MKILLLSDLHLEYSRFEPDPESVEACDVVVLAGDIHPGANGIRWAADTFRGKPIVYVAGNHEYWVDGAELDEVQAEMRAAATECEVHFLENGCTEIQGIRFLGCTLWTDYEWFGADLKKKMMRLARQNYVDFGRILYQGRELEPEDALKLHQASIAWLREELAKGDSTNQIVVTHHFPNKGSCPVKYSNDDTTACYGSHVDTDLMRQAGLWFHGHTHDSANYRIGDSKRYVRVMCNPRGYPLGWFNNEWENIKFRADLLVERMVDGNWSQAVR